MADGRLRKLRRLSTEDDTDGSDAWTPGTPQPSAPPPTRRNTRREAAAQPSRAIIASDSNGHIKLTVKASPNKLKEATGGKDRPSGQRAARKRAIIEASSDEDIEDEIQVAKDDDSADEEDEVEEEVEDEDEELDDDDESMQDPSADELGMDSDEDAEGDEDVDMEDAEPIPPPPIKPTKSAPPAKAPPKATATAPQPKALPTKGHKPSRLSNMHTEQDSDDDEELSELESLEDDDDDVAAEEQDAEGEEDDAEGEEDVEAEDDEEAVGEEDAEGEEDVDAEGEEELDGDSDDLGDSDTDATPMTGSRADTPDLSRMTRRQRGAFEEFDGELLALSNEAQKKKHLTAEEYAMRRAEMARRRKDLSVKRNEEEKMDTINRLLKKQAPKRRRKIDVIMADGSDENDENAAPPKPPMTFIRFVQDAEGSRLGVPDEWLEAPVGEILNGSLKATKPQGSWTGRMVEEVD